MIGFAARAGLALILGGLLQTLAVPAFAQTSASLEYGVKANYLVRFAAFVEWPPSAFDSAASPLVLCVAGSDPFGRSLDEAARGQTAHNRRFVIRRPRTPAASAGCHILYVAPGAEPGYLAPTAGRLLVTEAGTPGTIVFLIRERRVRFDIDHGAARRSGLAMSSRLLDLAITVRGR